MHVDSWILIALWQALLASWVAAGYLWWRGRAVGAEVTRITEQCSAAGSALDAGRELLESEKKKPGWQDHLKERLRVLQQDAPPPDAPEAATRAIQRQVLEHELGGAHGSLELSGLAPVTPPADSGEIEALESEVASLRSVIADLESKAAEEPPPASSTITERERELKVMVQQFTHDSREMLACIQKLESANTELRQRLRNGALDAA